MKNKRKFPEAKSEPNNGQKMVMVIKTRSPMEAYHMLKAGLPIDQAIGYYMKEGMIEKDAWMLDTVEKLHLLAEVRERKAHLQSDIEEITREVEQNRQKESVTNQTNQ